MKGIVQSLVWIMISLNVAAQYDHQDILSQLEGDDLLIELKNLYKPTQVKTYTEARHFMFREVYNNQDSVETIYSGFKRYLDPQTDDPIQFFLTGAQNIQIDTEHSYPRSKGADRNTDAGSDLHHLFPSRKQINSSRGNLPFGEVIDDETETWYNEDRMQSGIPTVDIDHYSELGPDRFEPRELQKGNIARAMFYFNTMYRDQADAADPQFFEVMKEDLCDWHFADPVDSLEWERSMMIGNFQGHEGNPFVLDCSLAARLYCDEISDACAFLTSVNGVNIKEVGAIPNPVDDVVKVNLGEVSKGNRLTIYLFDMMGKNMLTVTSSDNEVFIQMSFLNPGIYQLVVMDGAHVIGKKRLVRK